MYLPLTQFKCDPIAKNRTDCNQHVLQANCILKATTEKVGMKCVQCAVERFPLSGSQGRATERAMTGLHKWHVCSFQHLPSAVTECTPARAEVTLRLQSQAEALPESIIAIIKQNQSRAKCNGIIKKVQP